MRFLLSAANPRPFCRLVVLIKVCARAVGKRLTCTEIDVLFRRLVSNGILSLREKVFPHVVVTEEEINWRKVSPPQQHITAVTAPGTRIVQS